MFERSGKWQFTLRQLLLVTPLVAFALAIFIRSPVVRTSSLVVVLCAAAILLAERFVHSAATPRGFRVWRILTAMVWLLAGSMLLGTACVAVLLYGFPDSFQNASLVLTAVWALGAVYCFYRAGRELLRPYPKFERTTTSRNASIESMPNSLK